MRLEGKVVMVTGAARGLGRALALAMAREGAKVAALDICADIAGIHTLSTEADLKAVVEELHALGSAAIPIVADVRSSAATAAAVARVVEEWGRLDVLLNNAGVCVVEAVEDTSDASLDAIIDVNLKGPINMMRAAVPVFKAQNSGVVVNTSSVGSLRPPLNVSTYVATKGGVNLATKAWAHELAPWGINVNAVAPTTMQTPMIAGLGVQQGMPAEDAFQMFNVANKFVGDKGIVTPEDVAATAVFLASDDARTITGQVIAVDAGFAL